MRWIAAVLGLMMLCVPPAAAQQYFRYGKNKVQYEADTWYYVQSTHFDVYYPEGTHYLADFTAKAAEVAYAELETLFQHEISDRIPILVYPSHNAFAVTNAVDLPTYAEGIGGVTELFKNRVAVPFTGDYRSYRQTLHHELVHAMLNDMFYGGSIQSIIQNQIQLRIPHWFNEGLAEYASEGWSSEADAWMRDATIHDELPPIPYLGGFASYQAGQSVWDYVAEQYGREKVGEVLQRLRLTRSVEASFKRATGLSLEDLSERWQKTLKEVHFPEIAAREDLAEIAKPLITRETGGFYNTSPALSPQGDRIAYVTTKNGLFDVYIASANDGANARRLIEGQTSPEFESLRILSPGLTWSPDGRQLALAVKSGPSDAIALVDVQTGQARHYRIPDIDQIVSVAWSPQGDRIAFQASMQSQSDLYVLDLGTQETFNYTNDLFSDFEPAWSPDGQALVFYSDRGAHTALGRVRLDDEGRAADGGVPFDMAAHDFGQHDVYLLRLGSDRVERLTFNELWDDVSPKFSPDGQRILFLSDRNGIFNLYAKDLAAGTTEPLTDVLAGIQQVSLSADGRRAALVALREGTPTIYLLKDPFERRLDRTTLVPTVWAQRVTQDTTVPAPALALAPPSLRQANPFLRDASDGAGYARWRTRAQRLVASRAPVVLGLGSAGPGPAGADSSGTAEARAETGDDDVIRSADLVAGGDTTVFDQMRVDYRNYVFSEAFDEAAGEEDAYDLYANRFAPRDNVDADGRFKEKRYKLKFSPDLVYGTTGYDMLYGVQGVTQMLFSDMLGDHQIFVATNLLIDLRNSDYIVSYSYLPRRIDWSVSGYHLSRLLPDYDRLTYFRYRRYGFGISASYPLDKFRRLDGELSLVGVSQADIGDPTRAPSTRRLVLPTLTYTKDVTVPGFMHPSGGSRFAVSVSASPGPFNERSGFVTLLADARRYVGFGQGRYSIALRLSGGTSLGAGQQLFYASGVQNWINRDFDDTNGFPIAAAEDFLFATPVLPLRGYDINTQNGSHFGLLNAEFRFPLVAALLPGPLPLFPLYNIQGQAFLDAGTVWGGRNDQNRRFNLLRTDANGDRVLDDLRIGAGFGLRTILFGFPVRLDYAWPFDGRRFGDRQLYLSLGLDF